MAPFVLRTLKNPLLGIIIIFFGLQYLDINVQYCSKINCCALDPFNYLFFCFVTCLPPMISMIIPIIARILRTKNGRNENTVSPCHCNPNNVSFSPTIANNGLKNKLSANNTIPQIILLFIDSKPLFQLRLWHNHQLIRELT